METNTNNRLFLIVGGAAAALALVLGAGWFAAPFLAGEPEPPKVVAAAPKPQARQARAGRPQLGGGPVVYQADDAEGGEAAGRRAGGRQASRQAGREDRAAAFNEHLDEYAKTQGWNAEQTEQVRGVILETVQNARETISEARQAKDRDLARSGLQQLRSEQQRQLTEILGPEGSAAFVQDMDFGQYFPRVAERRGSRAGAGAARGLE